MARIDFNIKIKGVSINAYINLEGQQLYFFKQGNESERQRWVKSCLSREMEISNVEIKGEEV